MENTKIRKSWTDRLPEDVHNRLCNCSSRRSDLQTLVNVKWAAMVEAGKKEQGFTKEDALVSILDLPNYEYPKAMMTSQQMAHNTATVNCGGEWVSPKTSRLLAERVLADAGFKKYLVDFDALACIEAVGGSYPYSQIRITFREH